MRMLNTSWHRLRSLGVVLTIVLVGISLPVRAARPGMPVVLRGEDLAWRGAIPSQVVAFIYQGEWMRIPVQIDERDVVEYSRIYGDPNEGVQSRGGFGHGVFGEVYCDPNTFTGEDSDPTLDANDELVFMHGDAGDRAPDVAVPEGVIAGSGREFAIRDPLTHETVYAYLFLQDGSLPAAVGRPYVTYDFQLLSGDYRSTYNTLGLDEETGQQNDDHGPQLNPENSVIHTNTYERHWSYRWTCDSLSLFDGPSIVEREDYWIAPGSCGRHNGTFNAQEGAIIANVSGPVRAIRSVMGANSGPLVQQDRIYYQGVEEAAIDFRVHPRPAVGMFYSDMTENAIGMTYLTDLSAAPVVIDGQPDDVEGGRIRWELITGELGSLVRVHSIDASFDIPDEAFDLFYADDINTRIPLCVACRDGCEAPQALGDPHLIGASGVWITSPLPNTDPALFGTDHLTSTVTLFYGESGWTAQDASARSEWLRAPLEIRLTAWPTGRGD